MEHAIRSEIHVKLEEDPAFYSSLRGAAEAHLLDTEGERVDRVVSWTSSTDPTCDALVPKQGQTTQSLTAGQQILAFIYGSSPTDAHIALAPIAP